MVLLDPHTEVETLYVWKTPVQLSWDEHGIALVKSEMKLRDLIGDVQGIMKGVAIIGPDKIIADAEYSKLSWAIDKMSG